MGIWLRRLAIVAVLGFPAAVIGTRLGLFDFRFGFGIVTGAIYLAILVLVASLLFAFLHRHSNPASAAVSRWAALLCILPIFGLGSQLMLAGSKPAIHNISTDMVNPPKFVKVVALRESHANPLDYDRKKIASLQIQAYPEVKTLHTSLSQAEAHARTLKLVKQLGWDLVHNDEKAGMIEATDTSLLWGFKDDVVIRLQTLDGNTQIDLRSVSRVGESDLGVNAKRILKFISAFES